MWPPGTHWKHCGKEVLATGSTGSVPEAGTIYGAAIVVNASTLKLAAASRPIARGMADGWSDFTFMVSIMGELRFCIIILNLQAAVRLLILYCLILGG